MLDPAVLQKEASRARESKAERAQTDSNVFTSKLPSGASLEQSPSPIKAMESRPLPSSGPGSSHHYSRGQGKSQQHHHPLDQQHAASGPEHSREKSQSKPFSMQEQELRALGKTAATAANFIDVIIMCPMSCDKGQRERGSLSTSSTSDGKPQEEGEESCGLAPILFHYFLFSIVHFGYWLCQLPKCVCPSPPRLLRYCSHYLGIFSSPTLPSQALFCKCHAVPGIAFTDNSNLLILISPPLEIPRQSVTNSCGQ